MTTNFLEEFDQESQELLKEIQFLDFDKVFQKQQLKENLFENAIGNKSFEERSNERALKSRFGENSLFYRDQGVQSTFHTMDKPNNSGLWRYKVESSSNASTLIDEYKRYDAILEQSEGKFDEKVDFIIFIEKDYNVSFGNVLLIKMSNKMINETFLNKDFIIACSKQLYEQNIEAFAKAIDFENAFKLEVEYRLSKNSGIIKSTPSEIISSISDQLSQKIRGLKIDRENWDPTLRSDRYKGESFENGINDAINNLHLVKYEITDYRKKLQVINTVSYSILEKPIFANTSIVFLQALERGIEKTIELLSKAREKGKASFAFLCGIVDGLIEFICGLLDIVFLILELIFSNASKTDAELELDYLQLREGLEEFIEAYLKYPDIISKEIEKMINAYEQARFKDPNLTIYEVAHNSGEDLVFAIDVVISLIVIVKSIAKSGQYLPKFTEWIDDVAKRGGKGREKYNVLVKSGRFARVTQEVMKEELGKDFINALKKMGNKEDDILEYFVKYHNENDFRFLNEIDQLLVKYSSLSKTEAVTLWGYTTNYFYWDLNSWLRQGINAHKTKEIAEILTQALAKMPKYNGIAFRALEIRPDVLGNFLKLHELGKVVKYEDFVSCGSNTKAAFFNKPDKNVFLRIEVKNAPIISDFADGIKIRGYDKEELLLFRGNNFEIRSVEKIEDNYLITIIQK
ncbi:hypothetical protein [Flavobacterium soli]|uniref:hypothetical protein n=1 Tax=Flavobacterium soli TaxID=344881 RepID=UPI0003F5BD94|nr:hypothetical protein [Flavobacterium soli]